LATISTRVSALRVANPKIKAEYDALAPEFEIAAELLRARLRAGLSQAELAGWEERISGFDAPVRTALRDAPWDRMAR
jgi:hypothetical protein